ncbi:MAG TPA: hypothetical protein VJA22_00015 [Patescibacteria group bacterium]|nr:hypothetical protein [Patescibacteria group bacterium]
MNYHTSFIVIPLTVALSVHAMNAQAAVNQHITDTKESSVMQQTELEQMMMNLKSVLGENAMYGIPKEPKVMIDSGEVPLILAEHQEKKTGGQETVSSPSDEVAQVQGPQTMNDPEPRGQVSMAPKILFEKQINKALLLLTLALILGVILLTRDTGQRFHSHSRF